MKQMITAASTNALDTNILMYLYDEKLSLKRQKAENLLNETPLICTQVVSEFINVSKRKLNFEKVEILKRCIEVINFCGIQPVKHSTLLLAKFIVEKNKLQIFDAIIVASALESNCEILYSEDLQHQQIFENKL
jgi:predicted nucleic acid-binding protein